MSDSAAQRRPTKRRRINDVRLERASVTPPPMRCQHNSPSRGDVSNTRLDTAPLSHAPPSSPECPISRSQRQQCQGRPEHSSPDRPQPQQRSQQTSQPVIERILEQILEQMNSRLSLNQKLDLILHILRRSRTTFADLVRAWIESTPGEPTGRARQQKAKQLLDPIWDEDMLPLFERTDTFQERVTDSTTKVIRSELKELQKKVLVFGKYDTATNVEDINFVEVHREIEEHGPNLSRLIDEAAVCQRPDKHIRQEQPGRIVTITAMLGLGRARQSANFLTRALGVYLHSSGVRRRVINTLHGLGIVDCYLTIQQTVKRIAQHSQESVYSDISECHG